jgi:hypothetical protein
MDTISESLIRDRFVRFDEDAFCDWLARGLKSFYAAKEVVRPTGDENALRPFEFASSLIGRRESHLNDIQYIYTHCVPDDKKLYFRRSIGRVLRRSVDDLSFPEPAVSDLIYLVSMIRAYESVADLGPIVASGRYGKEKEWLQFEAIASLKSLLPSKEAVEGIRNLVSQERFHESFTLEVLTLLCQYEPETWSLSFDQLRGHFSSLREHARELGAHDLAKLSEHVSEFATTFAMTVPTNEIAKQLPKLIVIDRPSAKGDVGMCFLKKLFGGANAPIRMLHNDSSFSDDMFRVLAPIQLTADPVRRALVECETEQYRVLYDLDRALQRVLIPVVIDAANRTRRQAKQRYSKRLNRKIANMLSRRRHLDLSSSRSESVL